MNGDLRKTFGHAGVYSIGVILGRATSFIMLPVYTRYLSPSDYGIIEILEMTVDVISVVAAMGILHGLAKFYYEYRTDRDKNELVSTIFLTLIGVFLVVCALGVLLSSSVSALVFGTRDYGFYVALAFINLFLQFLVYVPFAYLRTRQQSVFFVVVSSLKLFLQLSLNVVLVVYLGWGVTGVLASTLIASLLVGVGLAGYTFAQVRFHFSRSKVGQLMRFGWPFVFSGLGAFVLTFSDRYFLNYYRDLSEVGVYALAYKFGFLLMMFPVSPLMSIWMVQRFELAGKEGYERIANQFLAWLVVITVSVGLVISLTVRDVLILMSASAFWTAEGIVPIIVFAYFLQACTDFFNFGILHKGETKHIAYGTLVSVIVIIALSFLLIPRFGGAGAAWATLVSFAVRLAYFYHASQRLFPIKFLLGRPIGTVAAAVTVYLVYWAALQWVPILREAFWSLWLAGVSIVLFFALITKLDFISAEDQRAIGSFLKSPMKMWGGIRGSSA